MFNQARTVVSNQDKPHEDLLQLVNKHRSSVFKRPVAMHTQLAFERALIWLNEWQGDVIIDACCGVGESTLDLARQFPRARVIGIDKSSARIQKHGSYLQRTSGNVKQCSVQSKPRDNYLILQADLNDFWRLLLVHIKHDTTKPSWRVTKQFILYPNPYPKKSQVGKRWHGSPVFPTIIDCCGCIEVRSNWKLYIEEFVIAAEVLGIAMQITPLVIDAEHPPITPFERKYTDAGQQLWTATTLGTGCDR